MVRLIYNLLWPFGLLLFLPGYLVKMFRRGGYREKFGQRLGFYDAEVRQRLALKKPLWLHAVSVGEVAIALKIAKQLRALRPDRNLILTTTTTTGFAFARQNAPAGIEIMYMPLDFWPVMRHAFSVIQPSQIVLVEAEVWPNLMAEAKRRKIPVALVNARLSPRSERRFLKFKRFVAPVFQKLDLVSVAEPEDVARWSALGVAPARIKQVGSVKFDSSDLEERRPEPGLRLFHLGAGNAAGLVLLGGSTHQGEEEILAQVFVNLRPRFPGLCLFLAPRHVERARAIRQRLESRALNVKLVSEAAVNPSARPDCMLLDKTGELQSCYALATIAFVGKSLTAHGGQNPVEPIVAGVPVVFGPNMENFARLAEQLVAGNGAIEVRDAAALEKAVERLLVDANARQQLVQNAEKVLARHRGATARTAELIANL